MQSLSTLLLRSDVLRLIRTFFDGRDYLEVQTPVSVETPALEDYIDAIPADSQWLRTSPELHMKRLIQAGHPRVFQVGPCFRAGEYGTRHRPEFTMLEWYCANADYRDILQETQDLLEAVVTGLGRSEPLAYLNEIIDLGTCEVCTVRETFAKFTDADPAALSTTEFDRLLVETVEPRLGRGCPFYMIDYPAAMAALARTSPADPSIAERWELYIAGLEIANAYSELVDPVEQRRRFETCAELRRRDGREAYPIDEKFLAALEAGMPPTAGCALGIDRLLMVLANTDDIADVLFE